MGCNCGKPRPAPAPVKEQTFVLEMPSGQVFTFGSRLEAMAAKVRSGGRGTVHPT